VNPLPGLTPGYSDLVLIANAAGMEYDQLIAEIMVGGLRRMRDKRREERAIALAGEREKESKSAELGKAEKAEKADKADKDKGDKGDKADKDKKRPTARNGNGNGNGNGSDGTVKAAVKRERSEPVAAARRESSEPSVDVAIPAVAGSTSTH
jgi:hypothetical protein